VVLQHLDKSLPDDAGGAENTDRNFAHNKGCWNFTTASLRELDSQILAYGRGMTQVPKVGMLPDVLTAREPNHATA
jgi:hypothetical protein